MTIDGFIAHYQLPYSIKGDLEQVNSLLASSIL